MNFEQFQSLDAFLCSWLLPLLHMFGLARKFVILFGRWFSSHYIGQEEIGLNLTGLFYTEIKSKFELKIIFLAMLATHLAAVSVVLGSLQLPTINLK
jgi:hypothetical protein